MTTIHVDEALRPTLDALARIATALDGIAHRLDAIHAALVASTPPMIECDHPPDARVDLGSTMGHERWRCKQCGYEVTS